MQKTLKIGFLTVFCVFIFVFFNIIAQTWNDQRYWVIPISLLFGCLYLMIHKQVMKMDISDKKLNGFVLFLFIFIFFGLLFCAYTFAQNPAWDFGEVYTIVDQLVNKQPLGEYNAIYLLKYPHNFFVILYQFVFHEIVNVVFNFSVYRTGIILNILSIYFSIIFVYFSAIKLFDKRRALLVLLVCTFCCPFYLYAPIFYTDTLSMPMVTLCFLLFVSLLNEEKNWALLSCILGLVGCMSFLMKATGIFIFMGIVFGLIYLKPKKYIKTVTCLVVSFLCAYLLVGSIQTRMNIVDRNQEYTYKYPMTHWIMMGLYDKGGYHYLDDGFTNELSNYDERKSETIRVIQERLNDYTPITFYQHMVKKLNFTWGDGGFFAPEKLTYSPKRWTPLYEYVMPGQKKYQFFDDLNDEMYYPLFLCIILALLPRKDKEWYKTMPIKIGIIMLFLFLCVWETRSRYLVNMLPVMILLAEEGMNCTINWVKRHSKLVNSK